MKIRTTQKVIKIGSSKGVTLPVKDLKRLDIREGDSVDIIINKRIDSTNNTEVLRTARDILDRYQEDFKNLADR